MGAQRGRLRRVVFRSGIVAAVALIVGGAIVGYLGYERTAGPDGAVRGYFAALADGDAPRALAWGDVPSGPHTLLTSQVLGLQQRIAPLRKLQIGAVRRSGSTATVHVSYELAFARYPVPVSTDVTVIRRDGDWRLRASAVRTQLLLDQASRRAGVLGARVPSGTTLAFPGAVPLQFDTTLLELDPGRSVLGFDTGPTFDVAIQISRAGRTAVLAAVAARLRTCVTGSADATCPLPDERYVPGSLHGTVVADTLDGLALSLGSSPDGVIRIDGLVTMSGTFRRLTFANIAESGRGQVAMDVHAVAYAAAPLRVVWTAS